VLSGRLRVGGSAVFAVRCECLKLCAQQYLWIFNISGRAVKIRAFFTVIALKGTKLSWHWEFVRGDSAERVVVVEPGVRR